MKALKIIGIIVALIILLIGIAVAVLPSKAHVERSILIEAPAKVIYAQLIDFKKFNVWSPWANIDPDANYQYEGPEAGVGAKVRWESDHKDVGIGSQWIVEAIPNKFVKTEMIFGEFEDTSFAGFTLEEEGDATRLTWSFDSDFKAPYNLFVPMMDGQLGPYYETGLENLKAMVESMPAYAIDITTQNAGPIYYLGIKSEMSTQDPEQIKIKMEESFGALMSYMATIGKEAVDMPICLYFDVKAETIVMEPALPVDELLAVNEDKIEAGEIPEVKVVKGVHYGDYANLGKSHEEITTYIEENNLTFSGHIWEHYVNDPGQVTDTAKWETHIYYSIK